MNIRKFLSSLVSIFIAVYLSAQNTDDPDSFTYEEVIYVSEGRFDAPYFTFSDQWGNFLTLDYLESDVQYRFVAEAGLSNHPFHIRTTDGESSLYVTGDPISQIGEEFSVYIPNDGAISQVEYYCTNHAPMVNSVGIITQINVGPDGEPLTEYGPDGIPGTEDDYYAEYDYNAGPDGILGTADDFTETNDGWDDDQGWDDNGTWEEDEHDVYSYNGDTNGSWDEGEGWEEGLELAPESLSGLILRYNEIEIDEQGNELDYGWDEGEFSATHIRAWDDDDQDYVSEPYSYVKTGSDTGTLTMVEPDGEEYVAYLTFSSFNAGTGEWTEYDSDGSWSGRLNFEIVDHGSPDGGDYTDTNDSWDEGEHASYDVPVFYLMNSHLADLTGDANSGAEGYYAVDEDWEYDELTGNEVFGWWLEPVYMGAEGEFLMSDDDEIDGIQIVNQIATEEDLKGYFDQNLGEPVGYIYYGEPTTPPGGDDWDDNGTWGDGEDWEEGEHDSHDVPVFYLSSENLAGLGVLGQVAGYHALIEEKLWDGAVNQEVTKFSFTPAEMVQEGNNDLGWVFVEGATSQQLAASYDDNKQALNQYFESNGISVQGYIVEQQDDNGTDDNDIPVFYLSSENLDGLDLADTSYSEGNYIIDHKPIYFPGGIPSGLSYHWLEPVANTNGGWSLTEDEDGIQTNYTDSYYIEDYFEQNSIEPVGYLYDGNFDNGSEPGSENNETQDYGDEDWESGDPVFYLSSENLQELTDGSNLEAGNYAVSVEEYFDYVTYYTRLDFKLVSAEEIAGDWQLTYTASSYLSGAYNDEYSLEQYFKSQELDPVGFVKFDQPYNPVDSGYDNDTGDPGYTYPPYEENLFSAPDSIEGSKIKLFITKTFDSGSTYNDGFYDGSYVDPLTGFSQPYQPYFEVVEQVLKIGKSHIVTREGNNDWVDSYTYHVDENTGDGIIKLHPYWYNFMGDPDWNSDDLPTEMPPLEELHVLIKLDFENYDLGYGEIIKPSFDGISGSQSNLSFYFEIVEYGWQIHTFDQSSIEELTGNEQAQAGNYILMWAGAFDGGVEGYLEPVIFNPIDERGFPFGQYEMTPEEEDWITVDTSKYPQYEPEEFIKDFEVTGYWFEQDEWVLPQNVIDYIESNYRWEWDEPIGYYHYFSEVWDPITNVWTDGITVYLDDGRNVTFDLSGNFLEEFDPWGPIETEFSLELNPFGSSWGDGGTFSLDGQTNGSSSPAYVDIRPVSSTENSAIFRVSLVNTSPENISGDEPSLEELDLSNTDITVGTEVSLTFNYDPYEPNLLYVGGAEVTGYKLRRGDWDNPNATFTITAETIAPVPSESNPEGSIGSTFSFLVELGNENKYYGGAIFQSNVVGLDIGTAQLSDPWSSTYNFSLNGLAGTDAQVRAILPKWGINDHLYIWEYFRVQAAVLNDSGMNFIQGSRDFDDGTEVGSDFARTHLQGYEKPYYDPYLDPMAMGGLYDYDYNYDSEYDSYHYEQSYALDDTLFGIDYNFEDYQSDYDLNSDYYAGSVVYYDGTAYTANDYVPYGTDISDSEYWVPVEEEDLYMPLPVVDDSYSYDYSTDQYTDPYADDYYDQTWQNYDGTGFYDPTELRARRAHDDVLTGPIPFEETASKFDFDADGLADASLEISFNTDFFGDIQIGEPYYIPPPPSADELVYVKGKITDPSGNPIPEFGIEAFKENSEGYFSDPYMPNWREYHEIWELNISENGEFSLALSPGQFILEAWGWDWETGQGYKPSIYKDDNGEDILFDLTEGEIIEDINFTLIPEWIYPTEEGNIYSSINLPADVEFWGGYIELFPIDESGNDLTDYSVFSIDVESNGSIMVNSGFDPWYGGFRPGAPVGLYRLVFNTWGPPMELAGDPTWEIVEGGNVFDPLEVKTLASYVVRGSIKDENGLGVWGDIVFVDPDDESIITWGEWVDPYGNIPEDMMVEELDHGVFAFKIPEGSYKIRAENWSGIYEPSYYGGTSFDDAAIVNVNEDISGIDIVFSASQNIATINITVLDENNNSLDWPWFDFFDAYDEWGYVQYPWITENGGGSYTLQIVPGDYKIQVGHWSADEPLFMTRDDEGGYQWESTYRERAGILSASAGEIYDLGTITLSVEPPDPDQGNSISGSVITREGEDVPNAIVYARTTDYLWWFDTETDRNGDFTFYDIPDGDWVLQATPPFESDVFSGYFESEESGPHTVEFSDQLDGIVLKLEGSNVSGRVLYSKKDKESGESKIKALADAWIWVFEDEDQDGEPDYGDPFFDDDLEDYREYFAYTDDKGFFSLSLDQAGKYSLLVDMEGQLSSYDQEAISFTLNNVSDNLHIGNTIKVDWAKNKVVPDKFDIKRRISGSSDNMKSLFTSSNDHLEGTAKFYMDKSIKPGKSYEYKVFAVTVGDDKNTSEALDLDLVKVSKPIIYFVPPQKSISGVVSYADSNKTVKGAEIVAWQTYGVGYASTFSGKNGKYELDLGPGEWEVTVYRPWETKVDWYYEGQPKIVEFVDDSTVQKRPSFNFNVTKQAGGAIKGSIVLPEGINYSQLSNFVWIDCFDPMGNGDWAQPDSNGSFSIPLKPGEYEVSIWVDQWGLPGVGSPEPKIYRVGKSAIDIGSISLPTLDGNISGVLLSSDNKPLAEIEVWAWSDGGGWSSTTTDKDGKYSLTVGPGSWEVGYTIPWNPDGTKKPFIQGPPKRVRITEAEKSKSVNFVIKTAGFNISGIVQDSNKNPVSNLDGWVYVKEYIEQDDENPLNEYFENYVADSWVDPSGRFEFPTAAGTYLVGIWLPGESGYSAPADLKYRVNDEGTLFAVSESGEDEKDRIEIELKEVNSFLKGSFRKGTTNIKTFTGDVYAMRLDAQGWSSTNIKSDGSYEMKLPTGDWMVEYWIMEDSANTGYQPYPDKPTYITIEDGNNTLNFDFSKKATLSLSLNGTVSDESGSGISGAYVWVYREAIGDFSEFWSESITGDDGTYSIDIIPGGKYEVGVYLSTELRDQGYVEPSIRNLKVPKASERDISEIDFQLSLPLDDNFISGTVVNEEGNPLAFALVYAWNFDGSSTETETNEEGLFSLSVLPGKIWQVGAEYSELNEEGYEIYYSSAFDLDVDLRDIASAENLVLSISASDFLIPEGISETFDPSKDFITVLPDGTEILIPGGASNVDESVSLLRLVVTPKAKGLAKSGTVKTADYGYSIELFNVNGKKVEGNFKKDVVISVPVDIHSMKENGLDVDNLEGKYFSSTKNAWESAKTSVWDQNNSKLVMTTDHFSDYVVGAAPNASDITAESLKNSDTSYAGWYYSDWLGHFYDGGKGWVFLSDLGWLYSSLSDKEDSSYWLYDDDLGWLWTSKEVYDVNDSEKSYFFSNDLGRFLFYDTAKGFYDYELETWSN